MSNKIKIIPLGGLGEIGKNMTVIESENDLIVIDCGLSFPDDSMLGIDLVIADMSYLEENKDKIRGLFLTHAHEDHIGGIPYMIQKVNIPIYGTKFTLGVLKHKLKENNIKQKVKMHTVCTHKQMKIGDFGIEFINVNHSIPGSVAIAIKTPCGTIIHTGDFKIDMTPTYGDPINLTRFGEYGANGVKLLLCESTNAEREGSTKSETEVKNSINDLFLKYNTKRITVATFSSNVYRLQSVVDAAVKQNRKIVLTGRSMLSISEVAMEQDILKIPESNLIDIEEVNNYKDEDVCVITTGSQGEPMSALYRMAFGEHRSLNLKPNDVVILSSHTIPGNEKLVNTILNKLAEKDVTIVNDYNTQNIHVSGHACQEELKILQALVKPEYIMPIHGEFKHLKANKDLAMKLGMKPENIIIGKIGKVVEMTDDKVYLTNEEVKSGKILVDGNGVGDVGPVVLRDRQILSRDGIIVVILVVDLEHKYLVSYPDVIAKGFVYVKESDKLIEKIKEIAGAEFVNCMNEDIDNWNTIKYKIRESIEKFIYDLTKRRPMIIPVLENL